MRTLHRIAATLLLAGALPLAAAADYVIIVNKDNSNAITPDFVVKAYRGEVKSWPSGGAIAAIAQEDYNSVRSSFDKEVLAKSPSQTKALWAQLTFSGKALPPKIAESDDAVIKAVAENKNALGYVSSSANISSVKAVK